MTSDHPIRRVLARVCSPATMSRIVDPVLADIRWENGRATTRGCVTLAKALALHAVMSTPAWAAATWSDDDYAIPKAATLILLLGTIAAVVLTLPAFWSPRWLVLGPRYRTTAVAIAIAPQGLILSLPSAIVLAIPLAFRRLCVTRRIVRGAVALSLFVSVLTFALVVWVMPETHQRFRAVDATVSLAIGRRVTLERGPNELSLKALRHQIQDARRYEGREAKHVAAVLEYNYQTRMALAAAALALGLAGLTICTAAVGRRRPLLIGIVVVVFYWMLISLEASVAHVLNGGGDLLLQDLCAWTPNLLIVIASSAILGVRDSGGRPWAVTVS